MAETGYAAPFDISLAHLCWQIGLSHESTAYVMRRSVTEVSYWWSVLTGLPVGDDPDEEQMGRLVAEIQSGWSPEVREQARRCQDWRESSTVVRSASNSRAAAYWRAKNSSKEASHVGTDAG